MSTIEYSVIADCTWSVRDETGSWHAVQVSIMRPQKENFDWSCAIQILWPQSEPKIVKACGVDSLQALEMGVALLHAEENMLANRLGDQFRAEPPT